MKSHVLTMELIFVYFRIDFYIYVILIKNQVIHVFLNNDHCELF